MDAKQALLQKRDAKTKPHLEQYAPVWKVDEVLFPEEEAVQFNVVFQHNRYGWVSRRYRYDGFNDVLYHKGQNTVDEEDVLEIQAKDPYIARMVADVRNAYGG